MFSPRLTFVNCRIAPGGGALQLLQLARVCVCVIVVGFVGGSTRPTEEPPQRLRGGRACLLCARQTQ